MQSAVESDTEAIIWAARSGCREAVADLLLVAEKMIRKICRCGFNGLVSQRFTQADLVQETLLKAFVRLRDFRGTTEQELFSWLQAMLRNNIIDQHRYLTASCRDITREVALDGSRQRQFDLFQVKDRYLAEVCDEIWGWVSELPEHDRALITMWGRDRMTYAEIAEALGITEHAVRRRWYRAIAKLRRFMGVQAASRRTGVR